MPLLPDPQLPRNIEEKKETKNYCCSDQLFSYDIICTWNNIVFINFLKDRAMYVE